MEAQAKNSRLDRGNSLVKHANTPALQPPVSYPKLNVTGISDEFAHSTKMDMSSIVTKAVMAALSAGILGRVGLGAFRAMTPKGTTPYGPDTGMQNLDISPEDDEKTSSAGWAAANNARILELQNSVDQLSKNMQNIDSKRQSQNGGGLPGWAKSLALGAGVPLAGYGLYKLFSPEKKEKKEEKAVAYPALAKQAEFPVPFNLANKALYNEGTGKGVLGGSNWFTTPRKTSFISDWLPFIKTKSTDLGAWGVPATYAAIPAGLAALYGGYKLTDYILDKRRKATSEGELESVKKDYEEALYDKKASADIDADFDLIAEHAISGSEKQADLFQGSAGFYGAYGILSALAAGVPAYKFFKDRSKRVMIARALEARQEQRHGQGIRPIYAYSSGGAAEAGEDDNKLSLEV